MHDALDGLDLGRAADSHKGDHGEVLVVGGSAAYPNTPAIVAGGALRTGVDLVRVGAPMPAVEASVPAHLNTMAVPLRGDTLTPEHMPRLHTAVERADCIVVGNGLGDAKAARRAVDTLLAATRGTPTVVDGDGIRAVAEDTSVLHDRCLLTPHAGELAALTGEEPPADADARAERLDGFADGLDCTILLKGPTDVVAAPGRSARSGTGTPQMTRGGTGDVLAGIAAGLIGQGVELFDAAHAAAALNGLAGERAVADHGPGFLLEEHLDAVGAVVRDMG